MLNIMSNYTEVSKLLGKSFEVFSLINDYIECFYQTDIIFDKGGKYGLYMINHKQGGKTLCTLYLKEGYFTILFVYGKQEREIFDASEYQVNQKIQTIYDNASVYHDGKWIWIDVYDTRSFADLKHFLSIKRKPNEKAMCMCGYKCNVCKAYVKNFKKNDQRNTLAALWKKYYNISIQNEIYCDGCRCEKKDAIRVDSVCPVRDCVLGKSLNHCGECAEYPCEVFREREGLSFEEADELAGSDFSVEVYNEFLSAYDNKTRLKKYKSSQAK